MAASACVRGAVDEPSGSIDSVQRQNHKADFSDSEHGRLVVVVLDKLRLLTAAGTQYRTPGTGSQGISGLISNTRQGGE